MYAITASEIAILRRHATWKGGTSDTVTTIMLDHSRMAIAIRPAYRGIADLVKAMRERRLRSIYRSGV